MIWIIVTIILFIIGIFGVLLVIGAGQLKTEEDRLNEIKEELEYWNDYEEKKKQRKNNRKNILKRILNFIKGG